MFGNICFFMGEGRGLWKRSTSLVGRRIKGIVGLGRNIREVKGFLYEISFIVGITVDFVVLILLIII